MLKNKTLGELAPAERLRELENQIVLGGAEGDMRCKICEQHLPLPPIPLDVEVWALAHQEVDQGEPDDGGQIRPAQD